MKKTIFCLVIVGLLLTISPRISRASTTTSSIVVNNSVESDRAKTLLLRLNVIKAMDKSKMTSSEKRELRVEVRSMQREYRHYGGVYVSVGTVLIIVLLILLLA
jgi:hypothetical protein